MMTAERAANAIFEADANSETHRLEMHADTLLALVRERDGCEWRIFKKSEISRSFCGFRIALNPEVSPGEILVKPIASDPARTEPGTPTVKPPVKLSKSGG